jgi:hypothetical protein
VTQRIILEIYQRQGFEKVKEFVAKMPLKVLQGLVKAMPEVEPFMKLN